LTRSWNEELNSLGDCVARRREAYIKRIIRSSHAREREVLREVNTYSDDTKI
jgi:hypothetical protein